MVSIEDFQKIQKALHQEKEKCHQLQIRERNLSEAMKKRYQHNQCLADEVRKLNGIISASKNSARMQTLTEENELNKKQLAVLRDLVRDGSGEDTTGSKEGGETEGGVQGEGKMNAKQLARFDNITGQLHAKEQEIEQLKRKHQSDLSSQQSQLKAKDERIQKLHSQLKGHEQAQQVISDKSQNTEERLASLIREHDDQGKEVASLRKSLIAVREELEEARKEKEGEMAKSEKLQEKLEQLRDRIESQGSSLSEFSSTKEQLNQSEEKVIRLEIEKEDLQEKVGKLNELSSRITELEEGIRTAQDLARQSTQQSATLTEKLSIRDGELAEMSAEHQSLKQAFEAKEEELAKVQAGIGDMQMENKIQQRRSVQLIKDLKNQLKTETSRAERLSGDLERMENALRLQAEAIREEAERAANGGVAPPLSPQPGPVKDTSVALNAKNALCQALAQRLEGLIVENEAVRERVSFLENNIQSLNKDLEEKRLLLQHFTRSSHLDAFATEAEAEAATLAKAAAKFGTDGDTDTIESLLEKSLLDNIRLKRDMKILSEHFANFPVNDSKKSEDTNKYYKEEICNFAVAYEKQERNINEGEDKNNDKQQRSSKKNTSVDL